MLYWSIRKHTAGEGDGGARRKKENSGRKNKEKIEGRKNKYKEEGKIQTGGSGDCEEKCVLNGNDISHSIKYLIMWV